MNATKADKAQAFKIGKDAHNAGLSIAPASSVELNKLLDGKRFTNYSKAMMREYQRGWAMAMEVESVNA